MKRSQTRNLAAVCLLLMLAVFAFRQYSVSHPEIKLANSSESSKPAESVSTVKQQEKRDRIPAKVYRILNYVRSYHTAPEGYEGGREFKNREHRLQERKPGGRKIRYQEWDVNPKVEGRNRGPERLVTGDDESAWYTNDHYNTFQEVKTDNE